MLWLCRIQRIGRSLGQEKKKFSCLKGLDGPILAKIGTMLYFELFQILMEEKGLNLTLAGLPITTSLLRYVLYVLLSSVILFPLLEKGQ